MEGFYFFLLDCFYVLPFGLVRVGGLGYCAACFLVVYFCHLIGVICIVRPVRCMEETFVS
jgi:hypothetical protein